MKRVDFYILADAAEQSRQLLACRLTDKAYQLGHRIYIQTTEAQTAGELDDLLWTFRGGSFLPHRLAEHAENNEPIVIGHTDQAPPAADVLINLSLSVPACVAQFVRIAEIINSVPAIREAGRQRYRYYREHGYQIESHTLEN